MGRSFYLYPGKNGTYQAEILNPETGERVCFRNTGTKSRDEAVMLVSGWLRDGIPKRKRGRAPTYRSPGTQTVEAAAGLSAILKGIENIIDLDADGALEIAKALRNRGLLSLPAVSPGPGNLDFIGYLKNFWDYDKSPYVKEKLAHNHSIGRRYCYEAGKRVERFWKEHFQGRTLASITRAELKALSLSLAEKGFSAGYLNMVLNAGIIPLGYAAREGLIAQNPAAEMERFSPAGPGRGCLTPLEAQQIFAQPWADRRAYIGNLLAMTSGLRHGEILAIAKNDIDPQLPILHVRHSWSVKDEIKSPKNGEARKVPVLPEVKEMLVELLDGNPHGGENPFIFWGVKPDLPSAEGDFLRWGLKTALEKAGINYKARKICFHSHRHFYISRLSDCMNAEKIQRVSGHKSEQAFKIYSEHLIDENVLEMGKAGAEVFARILQFPRVVCEPSLEAQA
jgi:integrase